MCLFFLRGCLLYDVMRAGVKDKLNLQSIKILYFCLFVLLQCKTFFLFVRNAFELWVIVVMSGGWFVDGRYVVIDVICKKFLSKYFEIFFKKNWDFSKSIAMSEAWFLLTYIYGSFSMRAFKSTVVLHIFFSVLLQDITL